MGRKRTGRIRELPNGRFEVSVADDHVGTFDTIDKAKRMKDAWIASAGEAPEPFSVYATGWMDRREIAARKRKRSRPFAKERSRWTAHVETAPFWNMPVKYIAKNPLVIQKWVGEEMLNKQAVQIIKYKNRVERRPLGRTLGRRVIEDSLSLVKLCLDEMRVAGRYKGDNPARLVKMPKFEDAEVALEGDLIVHLWKSEIENLLGLKELPLKQHSVFAVGIFAGLRPEELWGLQWLDVVLDGPKPCIRVRRTWSGPLKTKWARRDVPLLPPALRALRAWKAAQAVTPIGSALVWPNPDGKCYGESYTAGWRDKQDAGRHVPGWREKARVRREVDFKDLRHTCGCHLAMGSWTPRGLTLMEIKRWLGHSSIAVTERHYASFTSDSLHDAISESGPRRGKAGFGDLSVDDD